MKINEIAQNLVDATSPLVGGRTINIMDKDGIILASSEKERIGSFHQGAAEVIAKRKTVCIYKNQLKDYNGAKEGINMPIIADHKILGVVGIYGNPDDVKDVANVLRVYVALYFKQIAMQKEEQVEEKIRTELLKSLVYGKSKTHEAISQLCNIIFTQIKMPMVTIVVNFHADENRKFEALNKVQMMMYECDLVKPEQDIYGIADDCFVLLKSFCGLNLNVKQYLQNMSCCIQTNLKNDPVITSSGVYNSIYEIPESYHEAFTLSCIEKHGVYDVEENKNKLNYLMYTLEMKDGKYFIKEMYNCLLKCFGEKNINTIMCTIQVYYSSFRSINKASQYLHINKNTLVYRMNKIYDALSIKDEDAFTKEFFLRLILIYYNHNKTEE